MVIDLENLLSFVLTLLVVGGSAYKFREQRKRYAEINRAAEGHIRCKAEAEERRPAYQENYQRDGQVLKQRVINSLTAISAGKKTRLDQEALNAVIALQARQGDNPGTLAAWMPVIADLSGEIRDAKALQVRIDELL